MAIVGQVVVESRRYSGWVDPRYPIGYWQAALTVTGNASGGALGVDLVFQPATEPALNSQLYSVERMGVAQQQEFSRTARIRALNMGGPSNLGFLHEYTVEIALQITLGRAAVRAPDFNMIPLFLGSQREVGTTAALSLVVQNVDGIAVTFEAEGYRWSPRSVLVDGGPQRPPTGLYQA